MSTPVAASRALDATRLAALLGGGEVVATSWVPLTGGLVADTHRVLLTWRAGRPAGPSSVVVKSPSADPASRAAAAQSRGYETECAFYREIAPGLPVRLPRAFLVEETADGFLLVLEDLRDAVPADEARGLDADDAALVVDELARLHVHDGAYPAWLDRHGSAAPSPAVWRGYADGFLRRFAPGLPDDVRAVVDGFGSRAGRYDYYAQDGPRTLCHGDARPGNVLLDGGRAVLVDWQTARLADGVAEIAYLMGAGLDTQVRRAAEADLLARYGARTGIDPGLVRRRYRAHSFSALARGIRAAATLRRDDGADATVLRLVTRAARLVLDTAALDLLTEGPHRQ